MSSRPLKTHLLDSLSSLTIDTCEVLVIFLVRDTSDNTYHLFKYDCIESEYLRPEDIPDFQCAWRRVQWQQWDPNEAITDCLPASLDAAFLGSATQLVEKFRSSGCRFVVHLDYLLTMRYFSDDFHVPDEADLSVVQHFSALLEDAEACMVKRRMQQDENAREEVDSAMATQLGNTTPLGAPKA